MHLALVMVYVLIQMKLALVMAYLHIKMHLAPTMVYTFFKMLNLAWNMVYIVLGNSHGLLCPFRICTTLNVPIKTLVMIYISIKMQLTSTRLMFPLKHIWPFVFPLKPWLWFTFPLEIAWL